MHEEAQKRPISRGMEPHRLSGHLGRHPAPLQCFSLLSSTLCAQTIFYDMLRNGVSYSCVRVCGKPVAEEAIIMFHVLAAS